MVKLNFFIIGYFVVIRISIFICTKISQTASFSGAGLGQLKECTFIFSKLFLGNYFIRLLFNKLKDHAVIHTIDCLKFFSKMECTKIIKQKVCQDALHSLQLYNYGSINYTDVKQNGFSDHP